MDMTGPSHGELPESFPVFPLTGALLLPHGRLPLNIFEPRYLAMTEDALAQGRMIGVIQPDPRAAEGPTGPGLYRVGCLGRLSSFSETEDGRYLITLSGVIRFGIVEELGQYRGYRRVRAAFGSYRLDLEPPTEQGADWGFTRDTLIAALRTYFTHRGFEANWEAIEAMPDDALVTTLCMVCPFDAAAKQALLQCETPAERAGALLTLLQIDAHETSTDRPGPVRAS